LTAFARSEDRTEALAAGFQGHLVKPLDPQTLISKVASLRRSAMLASRPPATRR
jgi:CheY-like chemotaxis protein